MYDTETAEKIEEWDNGLYGDFRTCEEILYKKKTGEYFINGSGGALSKYSIACGNNGCCGSSDIIPLTKDDAKIWMETKGNPDNYIKEFGEIPE